MVTAFSTRTAEVSARDVREIDEFLEVLVLRLDPDAVPASDATEMWVAFDAVERRAAAAKAALSARRKSWRNHTIVVMAQLRAQR